MSDQDFFFEDDKPAKAEKTSSQASTKGTSKSASKAPVKSSSKSTAKSSKSSSRPSSKKGKSATDASDGQMVTMTLAIMFAVVSLFLGIIIGLYLPKLMGINIAPGSSTTPPAATSPSGTDRGIPDSHSGVMGGGAGGTTQ